MLISHVIENEITLTGLTAGYYYQAYVRSLCGDEASDWSLPVLFSTECSAIAIPYFENFGIIHTPPPPLCWDIYVSFGHVYYNNYENTLCISSHAYRSVILILPEFYDPLHMLDFNTLARWDYNENFFEVGVISDLENPSSFQWWQTLHYSDNQLQSKSVSFAGFTGSNGRIALRFGSAAFSINEIAVLNLSQEFEIVGAAFAGGSITPNGKITLSLGSSLTYTITPDPGYQIADVLVDGVSVGAVSVYTFSNIVANHTIEARFRLTTAIQETERLVCRVFPNPAKNFLILESNLIIKEIHLVDLSGRILHRESVLDIYCEVDISMLQPGLYIIRLYADQEIATRRFQVIK